MHRTSLAPVLSATRTRDSCWITWPSPRSPRSATASSSTAVESPSAEPCLQPWPRSSRRGRAASRSGGPSSGTGGGPSGPPPRRPRSCPSGRRRPRRCGPSARRARSRRLLLVLLTGGQLAFGEDGHQPGDLVPDVLDEHRVVELAGGQLEPEVEQLLLRRLQPSPELLVREVTQLGGPGHSTTPPSLVTNFERMGSLWAARMMASRATVSDTPESSNITRPGLTTATQNSGFALPRIRPRCCFRCLTFFGCSISPPPHWSARPRRLLPCSRGPSGRLRSQEVVPPAKAARRAPFAPRWW